MAPLKQTARRAANAAGAFRLPSDLGALAVIAALAGLLLLQFGYAIGVPFINDDFVFLDKTRTADFTSLWLPHDLAFHWYRPWSREFHYWALQRFFGPHETPFHVASFGLWVVVLLLYFALARRAAGARTATIATAGVAVLTAWGVPAVWIAGVQDLWMMLWALLALLWFSSGERGLAAVSFVLALLSKETAAVVPALALAMERVIAGRPWSMALRRTGPLWAIVVVWAALHPALGGRLWHPLPPDPEAPARASVASVAGRTLLSLVNLDEPLAPESGWGAVVVRALPTVVLAIGLAALGGWLTASRSMRRTGVSRASEATRFGIAWAVLGWLLLFMPALGWHAYHTLFGSLGAWLAIATVLARRTAIAFAVVGALAILHFAHADTPSRDWASEWYQRSAAAFLDGLESNLRTLHPSLPPNSRLFFVKVPSNVGFLAGDGPALRVWYGEPTLSGGFYSSYRKRAADRPQGPDYFFRYDSTTGWVPVIAGAEDPANARASGEEWRHDHEVLAATFARANDWERAATEYAKLAEIDSLNADYAHDAGVSFETAGDSTLAAHWYAQAASRPGADDEMRALARRFARHLRAPS
jgi:hypothetical protein